jgi:hypothetical protein
MLPVILLGNVADGGLGLYRPYPHAIRNAVVLHAPPLLLLLLLQLHLRARWVLLLWEVMEVVSVLPRVDLSLMTSFMRTLPQVRRPLIHLVL